ncbi:Tetratricopeptide repeat-containing protein [Tenacibaculum sp. MAR_2009_124]|uniref:ATP-binding protein n=1 Tax=Tenacibaculum sp. MAR_2009_124 TaxID=1250059 RepID=UPI0008975A97|nr:ATP-binding protein [Tenacibaculum sp. MAR_2009_124]SEB72047.1 Tetratricopeptide repeat-containing protein [Tenacibaculum sp. MAR_2009_124]
MPINKLVLWIIFFVSTSLYSQNSNDLKKLWNSYKQEENKNQKVKKLNHLANEYLGFDIDSAIIIAEKSKNISSSIPNNNETVNANLILSKAYIRLGKIIKALNIANNAIALSESSNNIQGKIKCLTQIAVCFYRQYNIDQAIKTIETSKTLADSINNNLLKYSATLYHAQFIIKKDIEKAEILTNEVYKKIKDTNSRYKDLKLHALRNKELILLTQGKYKLCKELCIKNIKLLKVTNNVYQYLNSKYQLGVCNLYIGNYEEGENIILTTEKLAAQYKFSWISAKSKSDIGIIKSRKNLYQKALIYEQEALQLIDDFEDAYYLKVKILNYTGYIYKLKGENKNAIDYFRKALIVAEKTQDTDRTRSILTSLADIHRINKNYTKSLTLYGKIEEINKASNIILDKAYTKLDIGTVYEDQKEYEKTIHTYKIALSLMNKSNDKFGKIISHIKLANCYSKLRKNNSIFAQEALYHYQESIRLIGNSGSSHVYYLESIVGIGKLLINSDKQKAKQYLLEAIDLNKNSPNKVCLLSIFNSLGKIEYDNKDYKKALEYYTKALELRNNSYKKHSATPYYIGLANTYEKLNRFDSTEVYINKAFITTDIEEKIRVFNNATDIFKNRGNYEKALKYSDSIPILKDQFHKANDQAIIDGMLLEMKSLKDLEIEQKKNELKNQQLKSRNYLMIAAFSLTVALLFGLFYFKNNNRKNKLLAKQEQDYRAKQDQLFANLSHEFRTPLTILKTSIEKTKNVPDSNLLLRNTNHLIDLTNQILDISKLTEKKITLNKKQLDIIKLTKQLLEQVQSFAESKNIELKLNTPSKVVMVSLDESVYRKIVINLVFNAIKFTQNGGLIEVFLEFKNNIWKLIVRDNGIGIDAKEISHLFERYYRAPLNENKDSTGGLGLALTKQLVELLKGTIEVKSELNKGSQFDVSFPNDSIFTTSENSEYKSHIITHISNSTNSLIQKKGTGIHFKNDQTQNAPTVLLIEDNPDLNKMVQEELINHFKTISAFNGEEALKTLEKHKPDIIVTDIMMPVMNGIEFIEIIKSNPDYKSIPIIAMSALEESYDNMKLWKLGVVDFVNKPFDLHVLLFKIKNNLTTFKETTDQYKNLKSLTANLIHDLRSPVVTLQMIANDLIENKEENEDVEKYLNYITENSNNLLDLINGLTEINRTHKRKSYTTFNIKDSFNNVLFNLSHLIEKTNAIINHEIQDFEVTMDKTDFSRILQNLIENALTYVKNDIPPKIDITILPKKKNILSIIVKDNGKGIPEKDFENIFKQLKRGKSSAGTQGSGLGLYIVKEIINKYHGNIEVNSKVNELTTFSLTLNLKSIV